MSETTTIENKKAKKKKSTGDAQYGFLEKMLNLITKYGTWNIIKAIMLIFMFGVVTYGITNMDKIVEKALTRQTEQTMNDHDRAMQTRREIKPKMDLLMINALQELHADRTFVMELHNGTNNTAGLPFIYGEVTYEQCAEGIEHADDGYTKLNLSRYEFPYILQQKPIWFGTIEELMKIDQRIALKLQSDNVSYIAVAVIHGIESELGYIGVIYCDGKEPADEELLRNRLASDVQRISAMLDINKLKL